MDNSVNLGGLTGLLNDYPEDMHELLVEMRRQDENKNQPQEHISSPPPAEQVVHHPE